MSKIATTNNNTTFSFTHSNIEEKTRLAELLSKSTIIPKYFIGKPSDIFVAISMGEEIGLKPIQSVQAVQVVNGIPSIYGDTMIALVLCSELCEYINEYFDKESQTATCIAKRKNHNEHIVTFSMNDAKKANLLDRKNGSFSAWLTYPNRMLQMRARGFALRDKFADVIKGFITTEEAQDYPIDVTPQQAQPTRIKIDKISAPKIATKEQIMEEPKLVVQEVITEQLQTETQEYDYANIAMDDTSSNIDKLNELIEIHNIPAELTAKWCNKAGVPTLEGLSNSTINSCIKFLEEKYNNNVGGLNE